ncbi:hypothetical protein [Actinoplanes auranticolor]|uniref:Uncharacterized protein n=1 Tax=Actinoplanes auranticolor TaxID=47988 RepID=A0A919SIF0_9ACTN|nr:hypothetical protein [Actinoplanes auranticolor]GIM72092.1 hypothetical protein Aau02nite_49170 [Actinoplanes auranticolor]
MPGKPLRPFRPAWSGDGRIAGPDDVHRLLRDVNAAGRSRDTTALAIHLAQSADDVGLGEADLARVLPAPPALAGLLPWPGGIRRGATVAAVGSTSLVIALLTEAMSAGSWAAIVGMPTFGALAAAEAGVPLEHLALIPEPGPDWPTVVSAAIDGVDIVVVATPDNVADSMIRALMNRARQKGTVLIPTSAWTGCDLVITLTGRTWSGLSHGHGRLRSQQMTLQAVGRGRAARPCAVTVAIPRAPEPARPAQPPVEPTVHLAAVEAWGEVEPT